MGWWPVTRLSNNGGGGVACMAVRCAGFQGRLCFCKGVCGLQVPRSGHCALFGELIYLCLGVYVGHLGQWVVMLSVWLICWVGCFVVCLGWLVIYPLALPGFCVDLRVTPAAEHSRTATQSKQTSHP